MSANFEKIDTSNKKNCISNRKNFFAKKSGFISIPDLVYPPHPEKSLRSNNKENHILKISNISQMFMIYSQIEDGHQKKPSINMNDELDQLVS